MWKTNPPSMAMDMDFSGDGYPDILARNWSTGELCRIDGNGANSWIPNPDPPCGDGTRIGTGWGVFSWMVRPGDFSGDGCHDVLVREGNGVLDLLRGNCAGGFTGGLTPVGSGWNVFTWILGVGDFSGDGFNDVLARWSNGDLCLVAGNGSGGWIPYPDPACGDGKLVGTGWNVFTWLVEPRDWGGGGCMDVMAELSNGNLNLYQGNCAEGWGATLYGIGSGWNAWEAMVGTGDFTGDGCPDILARKIVGSPDLYSWGGNCAGGWTTGTGIGWGWWVFSSSDAARLSWSVVRRNTHSVDEFSGHG